MTFLNGGCHCGRVRFRVEVERFEALDCNCSICTKKGFLHLIVPRARFELVEGEEHLATYTFGTHTARHHFCRECGMHPFYVPRSHPDGIDVNVRCLDDEEARARFVVKPFDGRHWEENVASIHEPVAVRPGLAAGARRHLVDGSTRSQKDRDHDSPWTDE